MKSKLKALRAEVTSVKGELISIDERIKEIEHISLSKEEEIKAEYDSQINDLEQALESIHKQKLAIHNKLMEESASYDIVRLFFMIYDLINGLSSETRAESHAKGRPQRETAAES